MFIFYSYCDERFQDVARQSNADCPNTFPKFELEGVTSEQTYALTSLKTTVYKPHFSLPSLTEILIFRHPHSVRNLNILKFL